VKLAAKKDGGELQGMGGYHYMLHPIAIGDGDGTTREPEFWTLIGYHVIEVDEVKGARLLKEAAAALSHQIEVAFLVDGPKKRAVK
jgi:hypothetical protein